MSANTQALNVTSGGLQPAESRSTLAGVARAVTRGVKSVLVSFKAACVASHMGQAYYLMDDAQLAELGMTKGDIPARLTAVMDGIRDE